MLISLHDAFLTKSIGWCLQLISLIHHCWGERFINATLSGNSVHGPVDSWLSGQGTNLWPWGIWTLQTYKWTTRIMSSAVLLHGIITLLCFQPYYQLHCVKIWSDWIQNLVSLTNLSHTLTNELTNFFLMKCINVRTSPSPTPFHQKLITSSTHWWYRQLTWRGHVIQGMFPEPIQQMEVFLGRDSSAGLPVFMSRTVAFNTGRNSGGLEWWTCAGTWLGQNGGWNKSGIKYYCQCNYLFSWPKLDKTSFIKKEMLILIKFSSTAKGDNSHHKNQVLHMQYYNIYTMNMKFKGKEKPIPLGNFPPAANVGPRDNPIRSMATSVTLARCSYWLCGRSASWERTSPVNQSRHHPNITGLRGNKQLSKCSKTFHSKQASCFALNNQSHWTIRNLSITSI